MSDTKYAFPQFAFYDRTGIRAYLEKQAEKGWILEEIGQFCWKFARTYPRKLHYTVVYFPKADLFDPEPGEQEQTFRDFCAHGGWTLAGASAQMQIFYTEAEHPTPIETDPVIEVENIHKSMKKSALPGDWLMLVLAVLQLGLQVWTASEHPLDVLCSNLNLFMVVFWIVFFGLTVIRLVRYFRWHRRAVAAAEEDGIFVETKDNRLPETVVLIGLVVLLFVMLFGLEDKRKTIVMLFGMAMTLVVIVLVLLFRGKLKREGYDAKTNKIATVVACVVLSLVVTGVGNIFVGGAIMNSHWPRSEESDSRLSLADLWGEGEYDPLVLKDEGSVLLDYYKMAEVPEGSLMTPRIQYEMVTVKVPALYEICRKDLMDESDHYAGAAYLSVDPAPWGAEEAWQFDNGDELRGWYVLCYADTIVQFHADWVLTTEQMATVGEIFG